MKLFPRLGWLTERSRPHYGQLVLTCLLLGSMALASYFLSHRGPTKTGPRAGPVSVLSWLPDAVLLNEGVFYACGAVFYVGAVLWLFRVLVPWSCWAAALGYNALLALYLENAYQVSHTGHVAANFLLIFALWYHLCRRDIRAADAEGRFWQTALYPKWVYSLSVFYLGLFYGMSGLLKWLTGGLGWPNGVSLQLWVRLFGDPASPWTGLLLEHRWMALALQWLTIIGETSGLLAIVSRRARPFVGLALMGFHYGAISVFLWGFHVNMLMLALTFLPFDRWVPGWVAWWERCPGRSGKPPQHPGSESPGETIRHVSATAPR